MNSTVFTGNLSSSLSFSADALRFFSVSMQIESHNIANVSTANFLPQKALPATGANGLSVVLQGVKREPEESARNAPGILDIKESADTIRPSAAELAKELPHMISSLRGFEANAKALSCVNDMQGGLFSLIA